jgi:hypothetical protein
VQGLLTLNLATPASEVTIRVCDLQGKIVSLQGSNVWLSKYSIQFNVENLPAGFYTLQITNSKTGESALEKFVKEE